MICGISQSFFSLEQVLMSMFAKIKINLISMQNTKNYQGLETQISGTIF
jgi:hypothetical protein